MRMVPVGLNWRTDRQLRRVAAIYENACHDKQPPTQTVATTLRISHSHAANLVAKCRLHGMLESTKRGRMGTPKRRPGSLV